jgi:pyruvate,water dikinase
VAARFSFDWDEERDRDRFWFWDEVHCPVPFSPLAMTAHAPLITEGTVRAAAELLMPFDGNDMRFLHGYLYNGPRIHTLSDEERGRRLKAHPDIIRKRIPELPEQWENVWLPELESLNAFQKSVPLGKLTWEELDSYRLRTIEIDRRRWAIHFTYWFTLGPALDHYLSLYRDLFRGRDEDSAYVLLQGFVNKSTETDQEIWNLAATVRKFSALNKVFEQSQPEKIMERLSDSDEGSRFKTDLDRFLATFGTRTASFLDIADVTWLEDPTSVLMAIQQCLRRDLPDPRTRQERLAREREEIVRSVRAEIGSNEEFFMLLRVLQHVWPVTESHQFFLDQPSIVHARFLYLEHGRRFAQAGSLDVPGDVFFLSEEELLQTSAREGRGDLRSLVLDRKTVMEEWKNFHPPPFLGTPPSGQEAERDRSLERVFGLGARERKETGKEIRGISGAPGRATGVVRVLESPSHGIELQPGEILVAKTTTPAWTPLFGVAAALVTDSGGALCHGAVVAREYGIPAVVGTRRATEALRNGDRVLVDGAEGKVILIGREPL